LPICGSVFSALKKKGKQKLPFFVFGAGDQKSTEADVMKVRGAP
jgi:hypothetical protein